MQDVYVMSFILIFKQIEKTGSNDEDEAIQEVQY